MAQAGGHGALTSVLISHQFTVLTAAELKTPAKIAQWATNALYAYNSNPDFAKSQAPLTRGLGPGVGATLDLYGLESAYPGASTHQSDVLRCEYGRYEGESRYRLADWPHRSLWLEWC